jgi:hypothetical protein
LAAAGVQEVKDAAENSLDIGEAERTIKQSFLTDQGRASGEMPWSAGAATASSRHLAESSAQALVRFPGAEPWDESGKSARSASESQR